MTSPSETPAAAAALLGLPDPYPPTVKRPQRPGVVLSEAFSEPMWVRTLDPGSGFTRTLEPAPPLRCARCGAQTSRTRILAVTVELNPAGHGERVLAPTLEAECPRCARERARPGTAAELSELPTALAQPEPPAPWETKP